jgi:hypothetical protein
MDFWRAGDLSVVDERTHRQPVFSKPPRRGVQLPQLLRTTGARSIKMPPEPRQRWILCDIDGLPHHSRLWPFGGVKLSSHSLR